MIEPSNPFFDTWSTPFGAPPFSRIKSEHFMPAYERAFAEHEAEIAAIAGQTAPPTFENTVVALENAGRALQRVDDVFGQLVGTDSNDTLLRIERDISPRTAAHWNKVRMHEGLFARIDALYRARESLGLTPEQTRVLERHHTKQRREGAALDPSKKQRLAVIVERLASLGTAFSQNVLADEQSYTMELGPDDLAGLPDFLIEAAKAAADERGIKDKHIITLSRSSVEPFLQFSSRRDLREKAFRAWIARGDNNGATDNKAIIAETMALRAERAKLLGYPSFAHYRLDDAMAKTPEAVRGLLEKVWKPARKAALADRDALQALIAEEGGNFRVAAWDWRYYAEKLRARRCAFEESEVKPYFQLDRVIEAAFYGAQKLFGLTFQPVDVPVWHPDVRSWEVRGPDGNHIGIFYGDYFARPSKQGGAWMSTLRDQEKLTGNVRPLVLNVMNFNKGDPTLLSFEDARTLFHEMGHGLHGLLSNVTYPTVSCTSVLTDWVELPSQLYEHWFEQPEVLRKFARHYKTGEPIPEGLVQKLMAAKNFDRGCQTLEYISSALVDLDLHLLPSAEGLDVNAFEKMTLDRIGMPEEVAMRHRPPHHTHVFSGGYYASAYYSYMWSEVLDADAFAAFEETGDIFNPEVARRLYQNVLSTGGSRDPAELYVAFRGRLPTADALLKKRGFLDATAAA
ncbi:MAG: M3 family metallopeptidase [Alphaproteobacteria bacterium]|nr:M3 family metallopeptidase [Alphaproteobacteria bacterium]